MNPTTEELLRSVLSELQELVRLLKAKEATPRQRASLESQAIVMAMTDERPTIKGIAAALNVPHSTLRGWKHFRKAFDARHGAARQAKRGLLSAGGCPDGVTP